MTCALCSADIDDGDILCLCCLSDLGNPDPEELAELLAETEVETDEGNLAA